MDETYSRILRSIDPDSEQETKRLLAFLCFSGRQLTIEELVDALAVNLGDECHFDPEDRLIDALSILDICPSLITLVEHVFQQWEGRCSEPSTRVLVLRVAHFSGQEYLISDRILQLPVADFSLKAVQAHDLMAKTCLVYLLHFKSVDLTEDNLEFPLAPYASMHWAAHAQLGEESEEMKRLSVELLVSGEKALVTWRRLFDPEHFWGPE